MENTDEELKKCRTRAKNKETRLFAHQIGESRAFTSN